MSKKIKIILLSLAVLVITFSLGTYFLSKDSLKENKVDNVEKSKEKNKYYSVLVNGLDGSASSFIPTTINLDLKHDSEYTISTSIDDSGNILDNDKVIVVNNCTLSNENKNFIKSIAGDKYEEALKEIEEGIKSSKEDFEKTKKAN